LVVVALSVFLIGAAGLAIDGSHMYAQRQMAQAAADAAAQAGILSVFDGTNGVAGNTHGFATSTFTCAASDARTPCYYAQTMNGFNAASDVVTVDFPSAATVGVPTGSLSASDPVNLLRVTVQRTVDTTLMRLLGPTTSTIRASGTAGIIDVTSPVPIIITHPTNPSTFSSNGNITIQICGGPQRSIQVNSSNSGTQSVSGNSNIVDLTYAGPLNTSFTCGTPGAGSYGADFGDFGGPGSPLFNLPNSTTNAVHYVQPASPIDDPLASVPVPPRPATTRTAPIHVADGGTTSALSPYFTGTATCPTSTHPGGCDFFLPGDWTGGITATGSNNYTAYFFPGIYYTDSVGFQGGSNGNMQMLPGANNDTSAHGTGSGMLVYNTGTGVFKVGSNAGATLVGSDATSDYKGILLFQDRSAPAHITKNTDDHIIGGGGALALTGTIYINNSSSVVTGSHYQLVQLQGGGGSGTQIFGEIITNELVLGGSGTINMNLNPAAITPVRQVALVN
jgi:Flp pilus assembly protein TadG